MWSNIWTIFIIVMAIIPATKIMVVIMGCIYILFDLDYEVSLCVV